VGRVARFRVFRGAEGVREVFGPTVVAFGKFDGVHVGHRALLARAAASARRLGLPHGAVTFERHPHAHLRGGRVPAALTSLADRLRLLRDAGAAFVVLLPTDGSVLGMPAEDFARDVLRVRMGVRLVVVGENFRFGRGGVGDIVTLRRLVSATGVDGVEVGMTAVGGEAVSATRIRTCLARGDIPSATELLGRPYDVLGRVCTSERASATVRVSADRALPAPGCYQASFRPEKQSGGWRPTVATLHSPIAEPHHLEVAWNGDYPLALSAGRPIRLAFEGRVPAPQR
jgi:riboflavin kinase/FMN adenylyltransferase